MQKKAKPNGKLKVVRLHETRASELFTAHFSLERLCLHLLSYHKIVAVVKAVK